MAFQKKYEDAVFLTVGDVEDDVFREAALKMIEDARVSVSRKLNKLYLAEVAFKGLRHEVWLNRLSIRCRTFRDDSVKSGEALGGYIKRKCLDL